MTEYFILKENKWNVYIGSIIKHENGEFIIMDNKSDSKIIMPNVSSTYPGFVKLSEFEASYLEKRQCKDRLAIYLSGMLSRIERIKFNDLCYVNIQNKRNRFSIIRKDSEHNCIIVREKDGPETAISIFDIDTILDCEYYISLDRHMSIEPGCIIQKCEKELRKYPSGERVEAGNPLLMKLPQGEAILLSKYDPKDRLEFRRNKLWDKVNQMRVGNKCFLRDDVRGMIYEIVGTYKVDGDSNCTVRGTDGKVHLVDVSRVSDVSEDKDYLEDRTGGETIPQNVEENKSRPGYGPSMNDVTYHILITGIVLIGSDGSFKPYQGTTTPNLPIIPLIDILSPISAQDANFFNDIQMRLLEKYNNLSQISNMDLTDNLNEKANSNIKCTNLDKISDITISKIINSKLISQRIPNFDTSSEKEFQPLEVETGSDVSLRVEEHEKAILYLTEVSKLTDNAKLISCLDFSVRMKDPKITENLLNNSEVMINLKTNITLVNRITQRGDIATIKAIFAKCETSADDSKWLIKLMQRFPHQDIIHIVTDKVKGATVTDEINREMLGAFWQCLINDGPIDGLKEIIACCTNVNDFIDGGDTILTKMIKETDVARMTEILTICTFDVNKSNKCGKSPLILACEKQPCTEKLDSLTNYCKEKKTNFQDKERVKAINLKYKDEDTRVKFYQIMHKQN